MLMSVVYLRSHCVQKSQNPMRKIKKKAPEGAFETFPAKMRSASAGKSVRRIDFFSCCDAPDNA